MCASAEEVFFFFFQKEGEKKRSGVGADDHTLNMFATGRQTVGDPSVATCLMMICIFSQLLGKKTRKRKKKKKEQTCVCFRATEPERQAAVFVFCFFFSGCFFKKLIYFFIEPALSDACLSLKKIKATEQLIPVKSGWGGDAEETYAEYRAVNDWKVDRQKIKICCAVGALKKKEKG